MQGLIIFKHSEFGTIRTLEIEGEPWFIGKDVATVLGYSDTDQALRKHVDIEDKLTRRIDGEPDSKGGNPNMTIINESGLYSLIFSSKLPIAKEFKRWVTSEVLPSIRKHGGYMTPGTIEAALLNPDTIIRLALELKAEQERRKGMEAAAKAVRYADRFADIEGISDMPTLLFPQRLTSLRKERGLTQEGLAKLICKRRSTVSGYETENKEPSMAPLRRSYSRKTSFPPWPMAAGIGRRNRMRAVTRRLRWSGTAGTKVKGLYISRAVRETTGIAGTLNTCFGKEITNSTSRR